MLCRHTIELRNDASGARGSLIKREELAHWEHANHLLSHAKAQADELISMAEKKCEAMLEQASLEIWQRADAQLKQWERDRQTMRDNLEHYATSITNQAIRCLLGETTAPQRLAALLKHLLESQVQEVSATLLCHPLDLEEIRQSLTRHKSNAWKLSADDTVHLQTLVLKTDEGDFRISWNAMLDTFFKQDKEYLIEI
ncbi:MULTISPECIES: type III secretion system stator protein SctL [unclassified Pseudomonas]|uniref:type III secretion system stator protein SctL n=1 Tax=unclassified Pseudomonas TaxID=196821 RepID=UPI00190C48C3|nr:MULTISPECIES: type III secretion system stator protein SctL [unclassified Pseudomonas]MBK3434927.1 type III secretion system stator protein SctL [Pseudomonas fluorescens]MBK3481315.1 type III secretion system stator protein SctL [Pseudomonas fluorescens]MEB0191446.1 type III secretion system stator protein SctL [Pseudomonas sp. CCI1.1]WPX47512.1 type III secretion system stator protein SctL [Pseudomonas sp. CCI1.1]